MLKIINKNNYVPQLQYKTLFSAGFDIPSNEMAVLAPGEYRVVKTGLFLDLEHVFPRSHGVPLLEIRARSGLAAKFGVTVLNGIGTVDADYPGEIGVILINHGKNDFVINPGDNIAQGLISTSYPAIGPEVAQSVRAGGFGSTGK